MALTHDNLCITVQPEPGKGKYPLLYCWCMCARCWSSEGHVRPPAHMSEERKEKYVPVPRGRCICSACTCHSLYQQPM